MSAFSFKVDENFVLVFKLISYGLNVYKIGRK